MNRGFSTVLAFFGIIKPSKPSNVSINGDLEEQYPIESSNVTSTNQIATRTTTTIATSSYPKINDSAFQIERLEKIFNEFLLKIIAYNGNDSKLVWKFEEKIVELCLERIRKIFTSNNHILDMNFEKYQVSYMTFNRFTSYKIESNDLR